MKLFGLTENKSFYFHRILKDRGGERGSSEPPEPPLDPPLKEENNFFVHKKHMISTQANLPVLHETPKLTLSN